jgi:hypothetical protein
MARYNEILRQVADDALEPLFWEDRDGTLIAADWADGFLQAIMLRMDAWGRLFKSKRDGQLLFPILAQCGDENGESQLSPPTGAKWGQNKSQCRSPPTCRPDRTESQPRSVAMIPVLAAPAKNSKNAAEKTGEPSHRSPSAVLTGGLLIN